VPPDAADAPETPETKMSYAKRKDAGRVADNSLLQVFLLVLDSIILYVAIFWLGLRLFFIILVLVIVIVIVIVVTLGDDVQMYRVDLYHFQLGFTLRAIQYLALFHFVLVDVDLDGAFRAAHHSRTSWPSMAPVPKRII
jgi:membrane protein YdbS with pleckstrin-like domain